MENAMSYDPQQIPPMFRIDVSADASSQPAEQVNSGELVVSLLRHLVEGQAKQNALLEEMNNHLSAAQKQRAQELNQWKEANPALARNCRSAAEVLSRVQTRFLETVTEEIAESEEALVDGEFMLNEFVDRFGPRMAHLNGVLQVLSQLGANPGQRPAS